MRFIALCLFSVSIVFGFYFSEKCLYAYRCSTLTTPKRNESQTSEQMIVKNVVSSNMLALVEAAGDYEKEAVLLQELETYKEIDSAMRLPNMEALDGYKRKDMGQFIGDYEFS